MIYFKGKYGDLTTTIASSMLHKYSITWLIYTFPLSVSLCKPLINIINVTQNPILATLTNSTMIILENLGETNVKILMGT